MPVGGIENKEYIWLDREREKRIEIENAHVESNKLAFYETQKSCFIFNATLNRLSNTMYTHTPYEAMELLVDKMRNHSIYCICVSMIIELLVWCTRWSHWLIWSCHSYISIDPTFLFYLSFMCGSTCIIFHFFGLYTRTMYSMRSVSII